MNFAKYIFFLIVSPTLGWKEIKKFKVPKEILLGKVYYPMMAILAITAFISYFYEGQLTLIDFLQKIISQVGIYFFGYMISSYILCSVLPSISNTKDGANKIHVFVIYIYTILMIISIVRNCIPSAAMVSILEFIPLYIVFVIWKGTKYFNAEEQDSKLFILLSIFIFGIYYTLRFVLRLIIQ